jgi:hypothetical protein
VRFAFAIPMLFSCACETTATVGHLRDAGGRCLPADVPPPTGTTDIVSCANAGEACLLASDPALDGCRVPGALAPGERCDAPDTCRAFAQCASVADDLASLDDLEDACCRRVCARDALAGEPGSCEGGQSCVSIRPPEGAGVRVDYGVCVD